MSKKSQSIQLKSYQRAHWKVIPSPIVNDKSPPGVSLDQGSLLGTRVNVPDDGLRSVSDIIAWRRPHLGQPVHGVRLIQIDNNDSNVGIAYEIVQALIKLVFRLENEGGINGLAVVKVIVSSFDKLVVGSL